MQTLRELNNWEANEGPQEEEKRDNISRAESVMSSASSIKTKHKGFKFNPFIKLRQKVS
jgi:hypothetical protein